MDKKERFRQICKENITRDGIDKLLDYIENKTDFFTAPASTKFHGNYEGGLLEHSLNVYDNLIKITETIEYAQGFNIETLTIISLFHDICKANFYKKGTRNIKDENGKWVEKQVYEVDDSLPLGHGEKSCIMLGNFIQLTKAELLAIRWHMGGFDCSNRGGDYSMAQAQKITPLVTLLQVADMLSALQEEQV